MPTRAGRPDAISIARAAAFALEVVMASTASVKVLACGVHGRMLLGALLIGLTAWTVSDMVEAMREAPDDADAPVTPAEADRAAFQARLAWLSVAASLIAAWAVAHLPENPSQAMGACLALASLSRIALYLADILLARRAALSG